MGEATVSLVSNWRGTRAKAIGLLAIGLVCMAEVSHAHQPSESAESLPKGFGPLAAGSGQQVLQEPAYDGAPSAQALTRVQPEAFDGFSLAGSLRVPALQLFSSRSAFAPDRLWHADSPMEARLGPRPIDGWRVVEVSPLFDPLRPFQRPSRALEMPAAGTTAIAQELGLPMRACIHRFRVPSRISDNGSFSIKAQWNVGCRF